MVGVWVWLLEKNSMVYKAKGLHLQVTVLLCVHTVRVLTVRTEVFNLSLLHIWNTWVRSPCHDSGAL